MSKLIFYGRLARQNLSKNRQLMLPFFLTGAGCTAMLYLMRFLNYSSLIPALRGSGYVFVILTLGSIVIGVTTLCILWYANRFVMKRRQRELGLYNVLGMEKPQIACVLALESFFTALCAILCGLAVGVLFSKLALMALLRLLRVPVTMGFSVSIAGLWQAAAWIAAVYAALLCYNLLCVRAAKPIDLLFSGQVGEKEPKSRWLLALCGAVCLLGGYAISLFTTQPLAAILLFFVAVILVIIGTFCLFSAGSVVILKALRSKKSYYYQPRHFTTVSGLLYRMKQNAKGLSNICILATMVLVTVSCTVCMYAGSEDALKTLYPYEIVARYGIRADRVEQADFAPLSDGIAKIGEKYGAVPAGHLRIVFSAAEDAGGYSLNTDNFSGSVGASVLEFIDLADYNRLTGQHATLAPNEVLAYNVPVKGDALAIGNQSFTVKQRLDSFPVKCDAFASALESCRYFVVADRSVIRSLYQMQYDAYGEGRASSLVYAVTLDPVGSSEDKLACAAEVSNAVEQARAVYSDTAGLNASQQQIAVSVRQEHRAEFDELYGGFLFLGLFLGAMFLLATVLIIYYKQLSEGYEDRQRFMILQQVGMSQREVRATIRSQVLTVFFLPLVLAAVHVCMAFPLIVRLFRLFSLTNVPLFAVCTVVTFLLFSAVYVLVYSATAKAYYQIVRA